MSTENTVPATPAPAAPAEQINRIGLPLSAYKGAPSTLCMGCGHDAITSQIMRAAYDLGIESHRVAKLSGIGCSSKTTAYFLSQSHGFNAVHGRMAAVATGVTLANRSLYNIGVSGDGDTASIGLGQFLHMIRRNVKICYIIENNGVYGLTKGQFSATADKGSKQKNGNVNEMIPIDCCALAVEMGCGYVARSFSGDPKQLLPLIKGALAHNGASIIDVVSPCVTFNNHEGSTKSLKFAREKEERLHDVGFIGYFENIAAEYEAGTTTEVALHDGSKIVLKKLNRDYDPTDKIKSLELLHQARSERLFLTGLLYHSRQEDATICDQEGMVDEPLASLPDDMLRPGPEALEEVMNNLT